MTTSIPIEELLPCPFCGDEGMPALVDGGGIQWAQVECVNRDCGAVGPTPATIEVAVAAWNTRADGSLAAENERFRDFIEQIACATIPGLPEEAIRDAQIALSGGSEAGNADHT